MSSQTVKKIGIILSAIMIASMLFGCGSNKDKLDNGENSVLYDEPMPWDSKDAKQPGEYTWEEFNALSGVEQIVFQQTFSSDKEFEQWMESAKTAINQLPWNVSDAKQPTDYSWDEFINLSAEEQIAFQLEFASNAEFEAWMQNAMPQDVYPWDVPGAKQPEEYSWAEYLALPLEYQIPFQSAFSTENGFSDWYDKNAE